MLTFLGATIIFILALSRIGLRLDIRDKNLEDEEVTKETIERTSFVPYFDEVQSSSAVGLWYALLAIFPKLLARRERKSTLGWITTEMSASHDLYSALSLRKADEPRFVRTVTFGVGLLTVMMFDAAIFLVFFPGEEETFCSAFDNTDDLTCGAEPNRLNCRCVEVLLHWRRRRRFMQACRGRV